MHLTEFKNHRDQFEVTEKNQIGSALKMDKGQQRHLERGQKKVKKRDSGVAATKVFTIPLIYEKILHLLTLDDLKTCRATNRQLSSVVSTYLIKKSCFRIHFKAHLEKNSKLPSTKFIHCPNYETTTTTTIITNPLKMNNPPEKTLESLNEILKNSKNFPCKNFKITLQQQAVITDLEIFFSTFGHTIHTLQLGQIPTYNKIHKQRPPTLFCMLTRTIVSENLESLDLSEFDYDFQNEIDDNDVDDDPKWSLSKLKYLTLTHSYRNPPMSTLRVILKRATNLKIIHNFDLTYTDLIVDTGKVEAVKKLHILDFHENNPSVIENALKFASCEPQLEKIQLFQTFHPFLLTLEDEKLLMGAFTLILSSSQKSLLELELSEFHYQNFHTDFHFPPLPNLEKLELTFTSNNSDIDVDNNSLKDLLILPMEINLNYTFPQLKSLTLRDFKWHQFFSQPPSFRWDRRKYFCGNFERVQSLHIFGDLSIPHMKPFLGLCPNFNKLILSTSGRELTNVLPTIFDAWNHLHEIQIDYNDSYSIYPHWDSIFTGFSTEFCDKILNKKILVRKAKKFRQGPWIGFAKEMKKLQINLGRFRPTCHRYPSGYSHCSENFHGRRVQIHLTSVSGLYAFQKMSNCPQIIIGYHQRDEYSKEVRRSLESISSFVQKFVDCGGPYEAS